MTASASQPTVRRERRIIERPRLIKLLDETDARTILLLAPAGYGKTTLARQWAKTLNGAVWMTLTPAHADVAWLAEDLAHAAEGADGPMAQSIREHIRARPNPQRASRHLGAVLAHRFDAAAVGWIVLDDYHEVTSSSAAEDLMATLEHASAARVLIATRTRPRWASSRRSIYGEIFEVSRAELAMTESEAAAVLGPEPSAVHFSEQAEGWPAVIGLAAAVESAELPADAVPQALHHYLAEELFQQASPPLQAGLLNLALRRGSHLEAALGRDAEAILVEAERLGFNAGETTFELHPLLREFLLEKVVVLPDADERVRQAVAEHVGNGAWDHALALLVRFGLVDLVDETLTDAFKPLARNGRLATLAAFARTLQGSLKSNASAIKVVLAEAAFADGHFDLALDLADAVRPQLGRDHPLASRVAAVRGQVAFLQADFRAAEIAFRDARDVSTDDRDEAEANYGLALASIFGEQAGAATVVEALRTSRNRSPIDYLRFVSAEIALRLVGGTHEGLGGNLHLDSAREMLPHAADPRVRTNLTYTIASALALRGEYQNARDWLGKFFKDAEEFGLEFAMPYANWTLAQVAIGQRRFGEAERALQAVEDTAAQRREYHHSLNANVLRARLLLQTGKTASAVSCVTPNPGVPLIPSWEGEYLATRALALACAGDDRGSAEAAVAAESRSGALEVRGLVLAARAVKGIEDLSRARRDVSALVEFGRLLDAWDPVVCAIRASPRLAEAIGEQQELRPTLEALCQRTGDAAMARRAGFRTRATSTPSELLSPREYEVLGLIARGYKNRDISRALFIADSTTKVHVRHILEKLGVRTRAEAAARLRMFEGG